jgi:CrcB protein
MEFAITAGQTRLITPTNIQDRFCRRAPLKDFLAISVAAILGANLRYILSRLAVREFGPIFPYGTLIINILGSFIVGLFVIWTTERVLMDPRWRLLVVIGFSGSFTTFSSYAFETVSYFEQGQWGLMLVNICANNLLCLGGALAGMAVARAI